MSVARNGDSACSTYSSRREGRTGTPGSIGPGTFVSVPTGVPHAFANRGDQAARLLLVATPPGHERCLAELADILSREGAPDPEEIADLRARFVTAQVS